MDVYAWRYQPEFRIGVLINGASAGDAVKVMLSPAAAAVCRNYGVITRAVPGGLIAYMRQHRSGVTWVPAVELTQPITFTFWLIISHTVNFFNTGNRRFGRHIFYANNLSAAGVIDSNLAANRVRLTAVANAGNAERGALSTFLLSADIIPGDYNTFRAGKIVAGAPVSFTVNDPVAATQSNVGLDVSLLPKGAYVVRLEGGVPVQERVVFDQQANGSTTNGIIEIYKDAWHMAPQPREYRINFLST